MKHAFFTVLLFLIASPITGFSQNKKTTKLIEQAQFQLMQGNISEGIQTLDLAIANEPNLASTFHLRGSFRLEQKDSIGAVADYSSAIKLDPILHDAYRDRGCLQSILGNFDLALLDLNKALELDTMDQKITIIEDMFIFKEMKLTLLLKTLNAL